MKVLIACECSGVVRDAFRAIGHDAWSCDLKPSNDMRYHIIGDVRNVITSTNWDLMIAHPPCTDLAVSGALYFEEKRLDGRQQAALDFFRVCLYAPIPRIAVENPISVISSFIRKPNQIIQPWMFGHGETKATCLWLKNLQRLIPTDYVNGREPKVLMMGGGKQRAELRSITLPGIADAMARQWGKIVTNHPGANHD